jgi:hypothetical protein
MYPAGPPRGGRGLELLLVHCVLLTGAPRHERPARERLEEVVGDQFARMLVAALSGDKGRSRSWVPA